MHKMRNGGQTHGKKKRNEAGRDCRVRGSLGNFIDRNDRRPLSDPTLVYIGADRFGLSICFAKEHHRLPEMRRSIHLISIVVAGIGNYQRRKPAATRKRVPT